MEAYQIILLIVVFTSFFYVALVTYVMGQMFEFKHRLAKRLRGLNLLLYERADAILHIRELFEREGVALSSEDHDAFDGIQALTFQKADEESVRFNAKAIKDAVTRVKYIAQANRWASKDGDFVSYMNLLEDLERNYRTFTGSYNGDVLGYNYWISIPSVSWIGYIFGFRPKQNLN